MELSLSFPTALVATISAFVLAFIFHLLSTPKLDKIGKKKRAPQPAGAWPIIGHLHLLGGSRLPHKVLGEMADKYGPIFTIKLGLREAIVISDLEMAKECYTTNDKAFANRPFTLATEFMAYNRTTFVFAPYGPFWRQMRKIAVLELLSQQRLEMLAHIRINEVNTSIRDIYERCIKNKAAITSDNTTKIDMKEWFPTLMANVLLQMISGKRYLPDDAEGIRFQEVTRKLFQLLGQFVVADSIPHLRFLDLGGYEKAMKKNAKEMDEILQGWLDERKNKKKHGSQIKGEPQVFIDVMISTLEGASKEDLLGHDIDTIIKATCLGIFAAATDTSHVTLTWALSLLLNNPEVLRKVRDELDIHVGKERQVEESDMKNLVYLQAVIKETLRIRPPGPLGVPHESTEDCVVGGFYVPKGTRLLVNMLKIQCDPRIWVDPLEFQPDRFLTSHKEIDVRGQNFELIPFGSGRRMCPGISFALNSLQFILARLIHGFEFARPSAELIDMTESSGLTNPKATPLEVLVTPRLSPHMYK